MADPYRLLQRFMSADETTANERQSNTPFIYLFMLFYFFLLLFFIYFYFYFLFILF